MQPNSTKPAQPAVPFTLIQDLTEALPPLTADTIVSRTLYKDRQMRAVLFGFAPGQELSEHTSTMAAVLQVLEGTATLTLGEEEIEARPGTWVHMPPGLPHSVRAGEAPLTLLLVMFRPEKEGPDDPAA
ncbi:cupin domain-containing protein [Litorilinea aerophila]|uniref:Cupin domain-containing protein n=1 Tax=Litorilinea aerophila TaxID=1204385 RepID=A0A540VH54_9CHLR|nr:cupin domain-containing protein [Litorilinea aerophila]MCC9076131.1 cupin domain-containing protein [Litorilinea aerophila]GIV78830.1 MAG: hypothetical protein KatS3mg050_3224 [Litorilinea sp.]